MRRLATPEISLAAPASRPRKLFSSVASRESTQAPARFPAPHQRRQAAAHACQRVVSLSRPRSSERADKNVCSPRGAQTFLSALVSRGAMVEPTSVALQALHEVLRPSSLVDECGDFDPIAEID